MKIFIISEHTRNKSQYTDIEWFLNEDDAKAKLKTVKRLNRGDEDYFSMRTENLSEPSYEERAGKALELIEQYGSVDGDHHKAWLIDQIVRSLTSLNYQKWIEDFEENGQFEWYKGIAP